MNVRSAWESNCTNSNGCVTVVKISRRQRSRTVHDIIFLSFSFLERKKKNFTLVRHRKSHLADILQIRLHRSVLSHHSRRTTNEDFGYWREQRPGEPNESLVSFIIARNSRTVVESYANWTRTNAMVARTVQGQRMKRHGTQSGNEAIMKREMERHTNYERTLSTDQWLPNPPLMEQTLIHDTGILRQLKTTKLKS